ncbi:MAG TPA: hypothetical protein VJA18_02670 [Candidatus Nanoarchaeia archaeon]|nr:hypothetical protein [Candidatus Nanoarchaeia archaeon]
MVKILIDLSEEEDKIVEVFKVVNGLKTKQDAIKKMVKYFEVNIKPKNLNKNEEYYKKALKF